MRQSLLNSGFGCHRFSSIVLFIPEKENKSPSSLDSIPDSRSGLKNKDVVLHDITMIVVLDLLMSSYV